MCSLPEVPPAPALCIVFESNDYGFAIGKYLGCAVISESVVACREIGPWCLFDCNFWDELQSGSTLQLFVKNRPYAKKTHSGARGGGEKREPAEEEKVCLEAAALFLPVSTAPLSN